MKLKSLENDLKSKKGFCFYLTLQCLCCPFSKGWHTSQFCTKSKSTPGVLTASVSFQVVTAFRETGKGYQSICKFAAVMNMPSPMNVKNYIAINNNLLNIYNEVASTSMSTASNETKEIFLN